jgi:hypothetical protein
VRLLIEITSIVAGMVAVVSIAWLSAWAYPRGAADIWLVAYVCLGATVVLGAGSVRRAYLSDRETLRGNADE